MTKVVRFHHKVQVKLIPNRLVYNKVHHDIWYTYQDYVLFAKNQRAIQKSITVVAVENEGSQRYCLAPGLYTERQHTQRRERRDLALQAVFHEQESQQDHLHDVDPTGDIAEYSNDLSLLVANACFDQTWESQVDAVVRGHILAQKLQQQQEVVFVAACENVIAGGMVCNVGAAAKGNGDRGFAAFSNPADCLGVGCGQMALAAREQTNHHHHPQRMIIQRNRSI